MSYCKVTDIPESECGLELYEDNAGRYHIFCVDDEDDLLWGYCYGGDWDAAASDIYAILLDPDFDGDWDWLRLNSGVDEDEVMDDFRWCRTADMARSGQVKLIATVYFGTDYLTCYSGIWASMLNSYFGMDFYALH